METRSLFFPGGIGLAANAQTATGRINGTLTAASGVVVPGADVTVANQDTDLTRETSSNENGHHLLPLLPVGLYSVSAQSQGFQVARRTDIRLNVNQVLRVHFDMVIRGITETIEVQATAVGDRHGNGIGRPSRRTSVAESNC